MGYRRSRSGGVEVDPDAAAEVRRVFVLIIDGKSVRKVAEIMTAETGRKWMPTTVARVLAREEYKRTDPDWHIIDGRVWSKAQAALTARRKRST